MPGSVVRVCLLVSVLAEATAAWGGIAYEVNRQGRRAYDVVTDGTNVRADTIRLSRDGPVMHDSILWTGSAPAIGLNSQNQTWYELERVTPFALNSPFLSPLQKDTIKKLTVQLNVPSIVDGDRHYIGRIAYEVHTSFEGVGLKVACTATFDVITTDTIDRRHWLGQILPTTGYPDVDAKISAAEASIEGFPLRLSMKATRAYDGGPRMEDMVEIQVTGIRQVTPELKAFTRPANYRHQRPVFGVPGGEGNP